MNAIALLKRFQRRALYVDRRFRFAIRFHDDAHALANGFERVEMEPLVHAADSGLLRETHQSTFGGIADHAIFGVALFELGIVTNKRAVEETPERAPLRDRIEG